MQDLIHPSIPMTPTNWLTPTMSVRSVFYCVNLLTESKNDNLASSVTGFQSERFLRVSILWPVLGFICWQITSLTGENGCNNLPEKGISTYSLTLLNQTIDVRSCAQKFELETLCL